CARSLFYYYGPYFDYW
nr:immunoglobulin heavy chain junction region [Mus musculus]